MNYSEIFLKSTVKRATKKVTCFVKLVLNEFNSNVAHFTTNEKTLANYLLQDKFNIGGKTRNISIQLVLQQCFKTSCTFLLLPILILL